MKIRIDRMAREAGSVLLITLWLAVIIGTGLAGYLMMAENQSLSVYRSQTWNSIVPVTEAGVEDALQLLNKYPGTFDQLTNWENTYSSDNWTNVAPRVYYAHRTVGSNYYDVYITNNTANQPVINSQGTAIWYYYVAGIQAPPPMLAAIASTSPGATSSSRSVVVQTKVDAIFNVAMAALLTIDFNGNNITTDSFDSADPNYSTNGLYPAGNVAMTKANGDVVTDDTITNSLSIGNANIKGSVKTGPNGSIGIGPNGSVGDRAWVEGGSAGIESGHSANDMNVVFPDVTLPAGANLWPSLSPLSGNGPNTKVNGVRYDYIITSSGDYSIPGMTGSADGIYISSNSAVRLYIRGDVNVSGQSQIYIETGGSLTIYMGSANFSLGGNGMANQNGNANSFYYFGLPSNTSVNFGGNANFVGAVYAPEAAFTLGGGGSTPYDFIGASVTKTVKMNGKFNFHYDENLRRNGKGRGYIPTNWKES